MISASILIAEPTRENVLAYLKQRQQDAYEQGRASEAPDPNEEFASESQLAAMEQARAWWPTDAQAMLSFGYALISSLDRYAHPDPMYRTALLTDGLSEKAHEVATWLLSEGRDPVHPNETPQQRTARKARERQQRYRDARRADADPVLSAHALRTRDLYRRYLNTCARRRERVRELDAEVAAAWAEYLEVKRAAPADAAPGAGD